jgi:hypothetical protein
MWQGQGLDSSIRKKGRKECEAGQEREKSCKPLVVLGEGEMPWYYLFIENGVATQPTQHHSHIARHHTTHSTQHTPGFWWVTVHWQGMPGKVSKLYVAS